MKGVNKIKEGGGVEILNEKNFGDNVAIQDKRRCVVGTVQKTASSAIEEELMGKSIAQNSNCSVPILNHSSSFITLESWLKTALHENVRELSLTNVRVFASICKISSLLSCSHSVDVYYTRRRIWRYYVSYLLFNRYIIDIATLKLDFNSF